MSTKTKLFLSFIAGGISSLVLLFILFLFSGINFFEQTPDEELCMFDKPQQEIEARSFVVTHVLNDGSAIAMSDNYENYGLNVYFVPMDGVSYYDDMKIVINSGQHLMQVGLYKYDLRYGNGKTIPVVKIMDR